MAVAVTATSTPQNIAAATDPQTFTGIINIPDTTGIALVCMSVDTQGGVSVDTYVVGVTLGGAAVTKIGFRESFDTLGFGGVWLGRVFHSAIGSTGSKNLVIDASSTGRSMLAGVVCFSGQDNTTPVETPVTSITNTTTNSVTVTGVASGNMALALHCKGVSFSSVNQTQQFISNLNTSSGSGNIACNTAAGSGGDITLTGTGTANEGASIGVEINQAAAGPTYEQTDYQFLNDDGIGLGGPPP